MTALSELLPRRTRLWIYLVAFLGGVVLSALIAGYAAIMRDVPVWLVYSLAAWLSMSGAITPALALGNIAPEEEP